MKLSNSNRQRKKLSSRGFTLIELLICIGIVAVLATLIVPAVKAGTARAQSAKCVSNLRQIGAGLVSFVTERKGDLPLPHDDNRVFYTWGGEPTGLAMIVEAGYLPDPPARYTERIADRGIFACPGLIPYKNYIAGGDQITYCVDPRNGRYRPDIGGTGVNYLSDVRAWDVNRTQRAQVACSNIKAHGGRPNVLYLDGHVEQASAQMTTSAYPTGGGVDFSKLDLNK